MATAEELAWAVGLFEGEGCIYRASNRNYYYLNVCMTDLDVLERFQRIIGYGKIREKSLAKSLPAHYKRQWSWDLRDGLRVIEVLDAMLPLLGERRGNKAREALASIHARHAQTSAAMRRPSKAVA